MKVFIATISVCLTLLFFSRVQAQAHRSVTAFKGSVDPKLGTELTQLYEEFVTRNNHASGPSVSDNEQYIAVDISFTSVVNNERAKALLSQAIKVDFIKCFSYMCSVRIPVSSLKAISNIESVHVLHRARAMTHAGSVTTEGDRAMFADIARSKFSVNGSGLLIGVLSDSYNCLDGAADDIRSGDLPSGKNNILVLSESDCFFTADEGRGMMQLIHDVAPGARLAFYTAFRGQADFATGILELAAAGCDIIVDDVLYFAEPMLQDGVIAQAVDRVVSQGIPYFSAAGNDARNAWTAPAGFKPVTIKNEVLHQFGTASDGSPITRMRINLPFDFSSRIFVFQWDEPFASVSGAPGSKSDVNIRVLVGSEIIAIGSDKNIGKDPVEVFQVDSSGTSANVHESRVVFDSGAGVNFEFATNSGTCFGHANAALAAGVGAASYKETPAFGVSPPRIESFSSAGGIPILLSKNGTRLSRPELRNQPRFTGPDGGATTLFGSEDKGKFRFFGTSAAAPHVAAVAALMLELKGGIRSLPPADIYSTLALTAIDMDDPSTAGFDVGYDIGTGSGLVNASAALSSLIQPSPPIAVPNAPTPMSVPSAPTPIKVPSAPTPVTVPTPIQSPTKNCAISWNLYNSATDALVAPLTKGAVIPNPPPCGSANIEAIVPCRASNNAVTLELFQGSRLVTRRTEIKLPYFLFRNKGADAFDGTIAAGKYGIRAIVNGKVKRFTNFTIGGNCD